MARIKQELRTQLPLALLIQGATVEHLAAQLRKQNESSESPVVALRSVGSRSPFFCVHPAGGGVICYKDLVRYLGDDQPVYGFQARGFEDGQAALDDLEVMAAEYVKAMRAVQPQGPYRIGGWSMGGVVAYEMATQLRAQGEEVALLALLDVKSPSDEVWADEDDEDVIALARTVALFARDLGVAVETIFPQWNRLLHLPHQEQLQLVLDLAKQARVIPPDLNLEQAQRIFRVFKANVRAMRRYQPKPSTVKLTLSRC
jgi:thioesterase domain-containing protein